MSIVASEQRTTSATALSRALDALLLGIAILAIWLVTRPNIGIFQDSRLYTLQALAWLQPERFRGDLFLQYGSQDRFSVFSWLYGPAIGWLGLAAANLALTVLGHALWLLALFAFARALLRDGWLAALAVAVLLAVDSRYGPLSYGEQFVTARLYAEAASLAALTALLRGRRIAVGFGLLSAMALHPLLGLGAVAVAFVWLAWARPRLWLLLPSAVALVAALAFGGVVPFDRLLVTFDPAWFALVRQRNAIALMTEWEWPFLASVAATWAALPLLLWCAPPWQRRMLGAVAVVGIAGQAVSVLGGDLWRNVLITDAQTWRCFWLTALCAHLLLLPTLRTLQAQRLRGVALALLTAAVLLALAAAVEGVFMLIPPCFLVALALRAVGGPQGTRLRLLQLALGGLAGAACGLGLFAWSVHRSAVAMLPGMFAEESFGFAVLAGCLGLLAARFAAASPEKGVRPLPLLVAASVLLALAAADWDRRSPWSRFAASGEVPADLAAVLPASGTIYWANSPEFVWYGLRRAAYFSCLQGSGLLFSHATAQAYAERAAALRPILAGELEQDCFNDDLAPPATAAALQAACHALPALDTIVTSHPAAGVPGAEWRPPIPIDSLLFLGHRAMPTRIEAFHIYRCAALR